MRVQVIQEAMQERRQIYGVAPVAFASMLSPWVRGLSLIHSLHERLHEWSYQFERSSRYLPKIVIHPGEAADWSVTGVKSGTSRANRFSSRNELEAGGFTPLWIKHRLSNDPRVRG